MPMGASSRMWIRVGRYRCKVLAATCAADRCEDTKASLPAGYCCRSSRHSSICKALVAQATNVWPGYLPIRSWLDGEENHVGEMFLCGDEVDVSSIVWEVSSDYEIVRKGSGRRMSCNEAE